MRRLTVVQQSFAARSYRDDAVVLRTHKLGEADRIITLLTKHHGQIRAVAKGVRRTSSKFGARLEPFMVADLQLVSGKTLDIVTQAVAKGAYGSNIAADYGRYTVAAAMTETAEKLTDVDGEAGTAQYNLLVGRWPRCPGRARAGTDPGFVSPAGPFHRRLGSEFYRLCPLRPARPAYGLFGSARRNGLR
ncbi:DNA repair protein RecO [Arthrobacter sp. Hiyo4]|nr:DNA repair protein RecO [Arthrobacter sp. Hiyo4]